MKYAGIISLFILTLFAVPSTFAGTINSGCELYMGTRESKAMGVRSITTVNKHVPEGTVVCESHGAFICHWGEMVADPEIQENCGEKTKNNKDSGNGNTQSNSNNSSGGGSTNNSGSPSPAQNLYNFHNQFNDTPNQYYNVPNQFSGSNVGAQIGDPNNPGLGAINTNQNGPHVQGSFGGKDPCQSSTVRQASANWTQCLGRVNAAAKASNDCSIFKAKYMCDRKVELDVRGSGCAKARSALAKILQVDSKGIRETCSQ